MCRRPHLPALGKSHTGIPVYPPLSGQFTRLHGDQTPLTPADIVPPQNPYGSPNPQPLRRLRSTSRFHDTAHSTLKTDPLSQTASLGLPWAIFSHLPHPRWSCDPHRLTLLYLDIFQRSQCGCGQRWSIANIPCLSFLDDRRCALGFRTREEVACGGETGSTRQRDALALTALWSRLICLGRGGRELPGLGPCFPHPRRQKPKRRRRLPSASFGPLRKSAI